ncbi:diguanylate cyclase, partial [Streptomyces caeruleatus]
MAERIRVSIATKPFWYESLPLSVTISVGVAMTTGDDQTSAHELLKRADEMLYRAKRNGRNMVM